MCCPLGFPAFRPTNGTFQLVLATLATTAENLVNMSGGQQLLCTRSERQDNNAHLLLGSKGQWLHINSWTLAKEKYLHHEHGKMLQIREFRGTNFPAHNCTQVRL